MSQIDYLRMLEKERQKRIADESITECLRLQREANNKRYDEEWKIRAIEFERAEKRELSSVFP